MHARHPHSLRKSRHGVSMLVLASCLALCSCSGDRSTDPTSSSDTSDDRFWAPFAAFDGQAGFVDALHSDGDRLYFGGGFDAVDGKPFRNAVGWDGTDWWAIGGAVGTAAHGMVHVILPDDQGGVYVAGMFDQVSGVFPASNVVYWNGIGWDDMQGGTDIAVRALALAPNGDLYVGGEFSSAGGQGASRIARWDGTTWHGLGGGANQHVMVAVVHYGELYVGGRFTQIGGKDIKYLARWDGSEWHAVGPSLNGWVTALAFDGDALYVGGGFSSTGTESVGGVARLDGIRWTALGRGMSGPGSPFVRTLFVDGDMLYAGGFFVYADGKPVNYIARWDGSTWNPLGSGVDYTVKNITRHGDALYVTGEFEKAGGKPSQFVARWTE